MEATYSALTITCDLKLEARQTTGGGWHRLYRSIRPNTFAAVAVEAGGNGAPRFPKRGMLCTSSQPAPRARQLAVIPYLTDCY